MFGIFHVFLNRGVAGMRKIHFWLLIVLTVCVAGCGGGPVDETRSMTGEQAAPGIETVASSEDSGGMDDPLPDVPIETRDQAMDALKYPDIRIRWQAVGFLREYSDTAFEDLRTAVKSEHEDVVSAAVSAISATASPEKVVPVLIEALDHSYATVRAEAVINLGNLGPDAAPAVDAIRKQMETGDERFREKASEALQKINN